MKGAGFHRFNFKLYVSRVHVHHYLDNEWVATCDQMIVLDYNSNTFKVDTSYRTLFGSSRSQFHDRDMSAIVLECNESVLLASIVKSAISYCNIYIARNFVVLNTSDSQANIILGLPWL
jgi:hypothetical protein